MVEWSGAPRVINDPSPHLGISSGRNIESTSTGEDAMRNTSLNAMLTAVPRRLLSTLLPATLLVIAGLATMPAAKAAALYSVPPSACFAPFLNQAFQLRWHEAYLMNPSDSVATYVICPLSVDVVDLTTNIQVGVYGANMSGAVSSPQCFFGVTDQGNLSQPPYIDGVKRRYGTALPTTISGSLWQAISPVITRTVIDTAIGSPTSAVTQTNAAFCLLPPGWGISQIALFSF